MTLVPLLLLSATTYLSSSVGGEFAWEIQIVDTGVQGSGSTSIYLDSEGRPHIAYVDLARSSLVYAQRTEESWVAEPTVQSGLPLGMARLVLDVEDRPHISYYDSRDGDVKYAHVDGLSWRVLKVGASQSEGYSSIALDQDGIPHIAYVGNFGKLKLAHLEGSSWVTQLVDPNVVTARFPSLVFDSSGRPLIAYYGNGMLLFAEWIGYRWSIEIVDQEQSPRSVTLAVDLSDSPKIAYRNSGQKELRYAWWNGSAWNLEVVDSDGDVGWDAHLTLDPSGNPHISYYNADQGVLKYAYMSGGSWTKLIVDREGVIGWWSSIAVEPDGRPHFSYYGWTDMSVRYAVGIPTVGIRTLPVEGVTSTSAVLVGEVTSVGDADQILVSFEHRLAGEGWNLSGNTTVTAPGVLRMTASGLKPETTYEFRIIASTSDLTVYSDTRTFVTSAPPRPQPLISPSLVVATGVGTATALLIAYLLVLWKKAAENRSVRSPSSRSHESGFTPSRRRRKP